MLLGVVLIFASACENELTNVSTSPSPVIGSSQKKLEIPSGPGETILGNEMANPYALENVQAANSMINAGNSKVVPTHYYLKFTPEDGTQIVILEDYAEENDYEFDVQPVHHEVIYEGDEGYSPFPKEEEGIAPEYITISRADFTTSNFPDVPYEVVEVMHIPEYVSLLTFTAFVISGNEKYYDAIEGYCHPDCPSWPLCLDEPEFTCVPPMGSDIKTVDPLSTEGRDKFPSYILDDKLGANGSKTPIRQCLAIVNSKPDCPDKCSPVLIPIEHEPDACRWECRCEEPEDDGGGVGPTPGLVENCGCLVYEDEKKPGGRIILEDTQLGDEGVQHVKILSTRYHWGFVYKNTDTNRNGCWKINKRYRSRKAKIKVVFRDRVSDRLIVRSWRGFRVWNAVLKPVKHTYKLTRNNKVWNNLCLRIEDTDENQSQDEEAFVAATVNNAVHDFYGNENLPGLDGLGYLIHTLPGRPKSAPMFGKRADYNVNQFHELIGLLADVGGIDPDFGDFLVSSARPDIFIPFQRKMDADTDLNDPFYGSDDIALVTYHETVHALQFARLGSEWWGNYVDYILRMAFTPKECRPYGDQSRIGHGLAELTEGMAEALSLYYADLKYEGGHSNNSRVDQPTTTRGRFINKAEIADFWRRAECGQFIPEGLFWDLFDQNDVSPIPLQLPEIKELARLTTLNMDKVHGLTFANQLTALNPFIGTIEGFKASLQGHALSQGITQSDYDELFRAYGH